MTQVLHKTFADEIVGGGGTGFDSIAETNGTVVRSETAGLNGTTHGALITRTADSPNARGEIIQTVGEATIWRTAWYADYSGVTIDTDTHETRFFHQRNLDGTLNPVAFYLEKESGALRFRFRVFTDSTDTSQYVAATLYPAWVEVRQKKESSDGAADGEVQFYFGEGDYPAGGQVVAEFLNLDNFGQFGQSLHKWGLFQSEPSVGGFTKVDEIIMRDDDVPIFFLAGLKHYPVADVTDGGWLTESESNVNLFASVDEVTPNDSDYIQSSLTAGTDICELKLGNVGGPPEAGDVTLKVRYERVNP